MLFLFIKMGMNCSHLFNQPFINRFSFQTRRQRSLQGEGQLLGQRPVCQPAVVGLPERKDLAGTFGSRLHRRRHRRASVGRPSRLQIVRGQHLDRLQHQVLADDLIQRVLSRRKDR